MSFTAKSRHWRRIVLGICGLLLMTAGSFPTAFAAPSAQADAAEWLIMVYLDADDDVLEEDMLIDLQEMELIGSSDDVHIVVQADRYEGSFDGMDDLDRHTPLLCYPR